MTTGYRTTKRFNEGFVVLGQKREIKEGGIKTESRRSSQIPFSGSIVRRLGRWAR